MVVLFVLLGFWIGLSVVATPIIGRFLTMRETPDDMLPADNKHVSRAHRAAH